MDKKAAMKRIAELTKSESWQEDKEIVAEVQKLGKSMWTEKPKRRTPRKIAIWHDDRILVTGTAEQLSEITGLSKNIIWDRARSLWIDSKGRQFRYVEEIMDLITQYSDIILKKIMMKIQKDKNQKNELN